MATLSMFFGIIIKIHREELFANWKLLTEEGTYFKIEPLR